MYHGVVVSFGQSLENSRRESTMMKPARFRSLRRRFKMLMLGLLALYVVFLAGMFAVMCQPPARFGQIMAYVPMPAMMLLPFESMWNVARGGATRVGEMAPDFTLATTADRKTEVSLASFRGQKPVVLVFGSYT
jgi:hypothetical protein